MKIIYLPREIGYKVRRIIISLGSPDFYTMNTKYGPKDRVNLIKLFMRFLYGEQSSLNGEGDLLDGGEEFIEEQGFKINTKRRHRLSDAIRVLEMCSLHGVDLEELYSKHAID
jgi:hypothetical protein